MLLLGRYEDVFDVLQHGVEVTVRRRDTGEGWGLPLAFSCCLPPPARESAEFERQRVAAEAEAAEAAETARWQSDDHYEVRPLWVGWVG